MNALQSFQAPFAQSRDRVASWKRMADGHFGLAEVVGNAKPTVLIGTSGQAHAFHESVVREMASHVQRPVIFPLSNPTERSEATPADIDAWTEGRAVIGTGSPFPPLERNGKIFRVDQTNNAYVYPGIGLGAIAVKAKRISDAMFLAAARTIAALSPAKRDPQANLLPPLVEIRNVTFHVAQAVAKEAVAEGLAGITPDGDEAIAAAIKAIMWEPVYAPYRRRRSTPR
jgi:malate dehydrogenase (oxaloacetate-decarboxylating)